MKRSGVFLLVVLLAGCSSTPSASPSETALGSTTAPSGSLSPSATPGVTLEPTLSPSPTATAKVTPAPTPQSTPVSATPPPGPTAAQLIGQKLMVSMAGTTPSADLLGRIRRGEVGGVILFGANISTASQVTALTAKLRAAAAAGHQPPLLIATDQEGGSVKRIPWAPPTLSPPQMGANGSTSVALNQGSATGNALLSLGINNDLAPVADVPASTSSFMYQQGRTWSFSATTTTNLSNAFATGLEAASVVPSMKHFPGIGFAVLNTDSHPVTIGASTAALAPGLRPYQTAIANGIPMIMLSNATYTAYDSANAAGWSHAIGTTLLRNQLGFRGVTITDSLTGTAVSRGVSQTSLSLRAAKAGTDMILVTGSEASTRAVYSALLAAAQGGSIARSTLLASYNRIIALKARL
jgi:beta-N-acetylhexosaminidase